MNEYTPMKKRCIKCLHIMDNESDGDLCLVCTEQCFSCGVNTDKFSTNKEDIDRLKKIDDILLDRLGPCDVEEAYQMTKSAYYQRYYVTLSEAVIGTWEDKEPDFDIYPGDSRAIAHGVVTT